MAEESPKTEAPAAPAPTTTEAGAGATQSSSLPAGKMHVKVYAPFKVYYDGLAESISAVNMTGPFDILQNHHNFMTLLSPGDIVIRNDGNEEKVQITRGVMHVKKDDVVVFLDV